MGVTDPRVVKAMDEVSRADFLPPELRAQQYRDHPLPIGHQQTTSQPSLIGLMLQRMELEPRCRVLEVGTGSGYQTALLSKLCAQVYSVEIVEPLAHQSARRLKETGYLNVEVRAADGYLGWPERAPFDAIVVSAAAPRIPPPLLEQLKPGGRLVIPVGPADDTQLMVVHKREDGAVEEQQMLPVRFVPLTGHLADQDRQR